MSKIDIAIPCYQYGRFLRECVSSVQSQNVADLRILIIDNASTDDSVEVAQELTRNDTRIEVVAHKTNMGPHASYNEAIDWATSDYFILIDADDLLAPEWLRTATMILDTNESLAFIHGREVCKTDPTNAKTTALQSTANEISWQKLTGPQFIRDFCHFPSFNIASNTVVRRTKIQKKAGYYSSHLKYADDIELWLRMAMHGNIASTERIGAVRRIHEDQISAENRYQFEKDIREFEIVIERFFSQHAEELEHGNELRHQAITNLRGRAAWTTIAQLLRGNRQDALAIAKWSRQQHGALGLMPMMRTLRRHPEIRNRVAEFVNISRRRRIDSTS